MFWNIGRNFVAVFNQYLKSYTDMFRIGQVIVIIIDLKYDRKKDRVNFKNNYIVSPVCAKNKAKMASEALASLTATYTDSEGEEDMEDGQITPENYRAKSPISKSNGTSPKIELTNNLSAPATPKPPKRLVSYNDDTIVSDEDPSSLIDAEDDMRRISMETDTDEYVQKPEYEESEGGVSIPSEPSGKCPQELQDKISLHYNRMLKEGMDMNKVIQDRKSFRNPSIYEKLIQFCNINELDTNYPPEIYDPLRWGKESYYDELARAQKAEMDKREKDRKEKLAKIDFTTGMVKKSEEDELKKRKSKWDQAAPNSSTKTSVKPAGLVQAALTASVTGTKGTIISAFGSLPKKPKV